MSFLLYGAGLGTIQSPPETLYSRKQSRFSLARNLPPAGSCFYYAQFEKAAPSGRPLVCELSQWEKRKTQTARRQTQRGGPSGPPRFP